MPDTAYAMHLVELADRQLSIIFSLFGTGTEDLGSGTDVLSMVVCNN